jgi:hypothetical protein
MDRFCLELRLASGCLYELGRLREIKVNQLSAIIADRMVVTIRLPVVTARAITKVNFMNQTRFLQEPERVVNGCIANRGQANTRRLKDLIRRGMIIPVANNLKHRLSLRR